MDGPLEPVPAPDELSFNYWLLKRLYIHPEELQDQSIFYTKGDSLDSLGVIAPDKLTGITPTQYFSLVSLYASVTDRYTRYIPPEKADQQRLTDTSTTIHGGIGAEVAWSLNTDSTRLTFSRVYADGPAQAANLNSGDRIVLMNGHEMRNDSAYQIYSEVLKDSIWIRLDVMRGSFDAPVAVHIEILKGNIFVPTVFTDTIDGVPVIQVREFVRSSVRDGGTDLEFQRALTATHGGGVRVIDLRGNPGGEINQCLNMVDEFLQDVPMIHLISHHFDSRGRARVDTSTYPAQPGGIAVGERVILAVDSGTASCAEIFVTALKDNLQDRATIVGTHTYGKGIGQAHWNTPAGGVAIVTSIQIRSPLWTNYHGAGIPADVVTSKSKILSTAIGLAQAENGLARRSVTSEHFEEFMPVARQGGAWVDSTWGQYK